jgi:hypothetical protein
MPLPRIQRGELWLVDKTLAQVLGLKLASEGSHPQP